MNREVIDMRIKRLEKELALISAKLAVTVDLLTIPHQEVEELYISLSLPEEE
ncbi:MAG: hypothetical protein FWE12_06495 [Oscillospiraceae bacterium]|nr:hypothetical protein [Oscillospiraceae bacterium]